MTMEAGCRSSYSRNTGAQPFAGDCLMNRSVYRYTVQKL